MIHSWKRTLAMILALVMVFGLMPAAPALAEDDDLALEVPSEEGEPAPVGEPEPPSEEIPPALPAGGAELAEDAAHSLPSEEGQSESVGDGVLDVPSDDPEAVPPGDELRDAYAFTREPESGSYNPETMRYLAVWEASFAPVKVELVERLNGESTVLQTITSDLGKAGFFNIPASYGTATFYIRAYYGSTGGDCIITEDFTVDTRDLIFTREPENGSYNPETMRYLAVWEASFVPVQVELVERLNGESIVLQTITSDLGKAGVFNIPASHGTGTFYIRAYYGLSGGKSTFTEDFTVDTRSLFFTREPESGSYDPDMMSYVAHWETSFVPVQVELVERLNGESIVIKTTTSNLGKSGLYNIPASYGTATFYIRAYYGLSGGKSTFTEDFTVDFSSFVFTEQPTSEYLSDHLYYLLNWKTNFVPVKVEVGWKNSGDAWQKVSEKTTYLSADMTYDLWNYQAVAGNMYARAFYGDGSDDYVESSPFLVGAPKITTPCSLPDGDKGVAYSYQLQAEGSGPITWSLDDYVTGLPAGLTLSSDGRISGTPTETGFYIFRVIASNYEGSDSSILDVTVGKAPEFISYNPGTAYVGLTASLSLNSLVEGDKIQWSHLSGTLPPGLALHGSVLVGVPTAAGSYSFLLQAKNYAGSAQALVTVAVLEPHPQAVANPASLTFPALDEGYGYSEVVASTEITVTNISNFTLGHVGFYLSGDTAGAFSVVTVQGQTPSEVNGNIFLAPGGSTDSSRATVRVRRNYGLAAGTYTANLELRSYGQTVCTVPLSFTVNALPDPPAPQQLFEADSGGKTWTLHDYHDNNHTEAGGWSSTEDGGPLKITLTKKSGIEYDLNVSIQSDEGWPYFYLYGNGEFHEPADVSADGASFTLHMPSSGTCSFYVWPYHITRGMDVSAALVIQSGTDTVELPLRAIGGYAYEYSATLTPKSALSTVTEGYAEAETSQIYTATNTGNAPFDYLIFEVSDAEDPDIFTIEESGEGQLLPGESRTYVVSLAEGQPAGTYTADLVLTSSQLGSVYTHYNVKVEKPIRYLTGKVTITGSGIHGTTLTAVTEDLPEGAVPSYEWHTLNDWGDDIILGAGESYVLSHYELDREVWCVVTCQDYEGELVSNAITGTHDWQEVSRVEPTCEDWGEIIYKCSDSGCIASLQDEWLHVELPPTGHNIVHEPAREATCENEGNLEHWLCTRCGACWLDEEATQTTTYDDVHSPIDPENHVIDAAHFPDAKFRAFVADFDTDGSGALSASERAAVTEIDCQDMRISSLTGVEYFPNLEILMCGYNDLTSLDLSANTKLLRLDCEENDLTALDLSMLPDLKILYANGNLGLSELDLSANPALEDLTVSFCDLSELDLSANPALYYLDCVDNRLSELDLSANPALEELYCDQNELTALNLSGNPVLRVVQCQENSLTVLDVSAANALEELCCEDNALTDLILGEQPSLKELLCYHNSLTRLDLTGCPTMLDLVSTVEATGYEDWIYYLKYNDAGELCELDVDPDLRLITSHYSMTGLEVTASGVSYSESNSRYMLAGRSFRSIWEGGNAPGSWALDSYGISGITIDPDNTQLLTTDPEVGGVYYVRITRFASPSGQGALDFSMLTKSNCTLTVPGYECSCVLVKNLVNSFGCDGFALVFKLIRLLPIDEEHFPDDIFRAYVAENIDEDGDGYLTDYERDTVNRIDVDEKGIRSLQGVGYFQALEFLNADYNNLTELDLSGNTGLLSVSLFGNRLEILNLDGLELLEFLDVEENYTLPALDLSTNTGLVSLWLTGNLLTELDVSMLTELATLDCSDNHLASLDVSGLPLIELYCLYNPLTEITLGDQPALKTMFCYTAESDPDLTELDLTGSPLLLDAVLNGTKTTDNGYADYRDGPLEGWLQVDDSTRLITSARIPGDVNGDGQVNTADVALLAKYVKARGQGVTIVPGSGDVNGDGQVNTADVALLAKYVKARGQGVTIH